ncbi:InlB B-repeat-containing protein, partial [Candidatus Saccharibacteria bacterium]|nr:InlB B-repeat-containing protein [Candidatus Saccharibacteria bacterium]
HLAGGYGNWFAVGENESNGTIIDSTDEDDPVYCAESDFSYPLPNANCSSSAYNSYQIGFGAKLTSSLPAGTYTNNVVFSAVAKSEGIKYTMNFNANGGTNTMGSRTVLSGSNIVMPSTGFTKDGYRIKGWAMVNNATTSTTPIFLAGQTVAINDLISAAQTAGQSPATTNSFTVYAVWAPVHNLAITNGNTTAISGISSNPSAGQVIEGASVTVSCTSNNGYHCSGWTSSNTSILPSSDNQNYTFTMPSGDITLTANGAANTYTIVYAAGSTGGSCSVSSTPATYGSSVNLSSSTCTRSGYEQQGWSTNSSGSSKTYNMGQSVSNLSSTQGATITLYPYFVSTGPVYAGNCSSTVHPTTQQSCKMADGNIYVYGNSGNATTWASASSTCPSGYSFPAITVFDSLIQAYGGTSYTTGRTGYQETTGALYSVLGLSGPRYFWSSSSYIGGRASILYVDSSGSNSTYGHERDNSYYVLCYK